VSKAKKKPRKSRQRSRRRPPSRELYDDLRLARQLADDGNVKEAAELLESLDRRFPGREAILVDLGNAYYDMDDILGYEHASERLLQVNPNEPDFHLGLAGAYFHNLRPALAGEYFQQFLRRWPDDSRAGGVRKTLAKIVPLVEEMRREIGLQGPGGGEVALLHDRVQTKLDRNDFEGVCQLASRILAKKPDFVSAWNIRSQAHFQLGRIDEAIADARQVLERHPDNHHALGNLGRYLWLTGGTEEAESCAARLKSIQSSREDVALKQAELLVLIGDFQGAWDVYEAWRRSGRKMAPPEEALLHHFAGVAAAELGEEREARRAWPQALKVFPNILHVQENLDDLDEPVGRRSGPWAFGLHNWIPSAILARLAAEMLRSPAAKASGGSADVNRFLAQYPFVIGLAPKMLERGNAETRTFVLEIAKQSEHPDLVEAVRDFALGQRGSDEQRYKAARLLNELGVLPPTPVRLWAQGEWREVILATFEVYDEPAYELPQKVVRLMEPGIEALRRGDGHAAEPFFREAVKVAPDEISAINNLAMSLRIQGREEEAWELIDDTLRRDPDYFFGHVHVASKHLQANRLDEAQQIAGTLMSRKKLHRTEFESLCNLQIEILLKRGKIESAESWLKMLKDTDSEPALIEQLEKRINVYGITKRVMKGVFGWQREKKK